MTGTSQEKLWRVAPGDPTCVFADGLAQPIRCHSRKRAALIAAAPELLAIVKDLLCMPELLCECGKPDCRTTIARAAVAKAVGRG